MAFLLDTNVIIQVLRGNAPVVKYLSGLELNLDTTVYVEALQGQKSNADKRIVRNVLDNYSPIHFTPDISKRTINLIEIYSNSHNLMLPDAQIAACCLEYNLTLITYNAKDFRFIIGLNIDVQPFLQI